MPWVTAPAMAPPIAPPRTAQPSTAVPPVTAAQTLAAQVQQRCGVIVATGANQVAAVSASKQNYPAVLFIALMGPADAAFGAKVREHLPRG
jgi:hypothetical protein